MLPGCAEDGVLPVGSLAENRRIAIGLIRLGNLTLLGHIIVIFCELTQIQHVQTLHLTVERYRAVVGELSLTRLTALGGNQHNAVSTLRTIDSGG